MSDITKSMQNLYADIESHLMRDRQPSIYLNEIYENPDFQQYPFDMLHKLKNTVQSPIHHPEGNVWNHTMLVVDEAAKVKNRSKNPLVFMWAAILHDIGKAVTTRRRKGKITAYDHDKAGAVMARKFLSQFVQDQEFVEEVSQLIRYHMQILYVVKGLRFADIEGMKYHTDADEIALLGLCDRLGRTGSKRKEEEENIRLFLQACDIYPVSQNAPEGLMFWCGFLYTISLILFFHSFFWISSCASRIPF